MLSTYTGQDSIAGGRQGSSCLCVCVRVCVRCSLFVCLANCWQLLPGSGFSFGFGFSYSFGFGICRRQLQGIKMSITMDSITCSSGREGGREGGESNEQELRSNMAANAQFNRLSQRATKQQNKTK